MSAKGVIQRSNDSQEVRVFVLRMLGALLKKDLGSWLIHVDTRIGALLTVSVQHGYHIVIPLCVSSIRKKVV